MKTSRSHALLAAAIGAVLALGCIADASAQVTRDRYDRQKQQRESSSASEADEVAKYPQAGRTAPDREIPSGDRKQVNAMITAYNEDDFAKARELSAAILAGNPSSAYVRALAAQIGAQAAYDMDDTAGTITLLQQAIDANGLGNNGHYDSMYLLSQLQISEGQEEAGLATLDKLLAETKSTDAQKLILKANTLYNLERYQEAAVAVKAALAASDTPEPSWTQLLVGIYFELDQPMEAARVAEEILAKDPGNKQMQLNLASIYLQADQMDKAAAVLEKVRASGALETEEEYRQLYATYLNIDGREAQAIAVIEEGLAKGILKPSHEVYLSLAQSYYYTDNDAKAIEFYTKAAPLDEDGDTYLNLARVLWQADRIADAKRAAQQAIDKGIGNPEEARKILALPN
jgi:tetratricopeptide (TPR) repeat protein